MTSLLGVPIKVHDRVVDDLYLTDKIGAPDFSGDDQLDDIAEDLPDEMTRARLLGVSDRFSRLITDVRAYIQGPRMRRLQGQRLSEGLATLVREFDGRGGLVATLETPIRCLLQSPIRCSRAAPRLLSLFPPHGLDVRTANPDRDPGAVITDEQAAEW